jgi:hypothetical protein
MSGSCRMAVPGHVMARQLGEECVMLDLDNGTYYGLDAVGARGWQLLGEGRSVAEACAAVAAEYEAPRETVEADVARLVEELAANGLLIAA